MKKKILGIVAFMLAMFVFSGCSSLPTYQEVLDEYTSKLQEASPTLLEEFKTEAAALNGDVVKLSELSDEKISKLAEISNEGIQKMAEIKLSNNDEESVYEEWLSLIHI